MFGAVKKVPTECPHCGFVQHEPSGLISTYCRGCGDHYTVVRQAPVAPFPKASLLALVRGKLRTARRPRQIACHKCGHEHDIPVLSRSTFCPACATAIQLHDIEILSHNTTSIRTRGAVHVGREGFLNATRVICGDAFVEGRIAGQVVCEGTLRLKCSGLCRAQITARRMLVDRGATLQFSSTLHVGEIVIRGQIEADIVCDGTLHIRRRGSLEGDVQARSMIVDKGGLYAGGVHVSPHIIRPDSIPRAEREVRVLPGWQPRLAFG